jgi:enoyl-CoA hydratase
MTKHNDEWVVFGRVSYAASGAPAAGVRVTAMDADLLFDDTLGHGVTDADGHYSITYHTADFREIFERAPDLYLVVHDADGHYLATTLDTPVRHAATRQEINVEIGPHVAPAAGPHRSAALRIERSGPVFTVILSRPERRNAVDRETALALADAFREFSADPNARVAVLFGEGGHFCAGADLKAVASGLGNVTRADGDGPMGPSRMLLSKPVVAAVAGYAVAGGLELALWCDLRVAERSAQFGVFCRRWGVPLIDGGTVRLPRIVGLGRALDMILTGRPVGADEALRIGLADRVVEDGEARAAAEALATQIASFPQLCMRSDRLSAYEQAGMALDDALRNEFARGVQVVRSGETRAGAERFAGGAGRHGTFE